MFLSNIRITISGGERKWVLMTEEIPTVVATEIAVAVVSGVATAVPEKCTRLSVLTVGLRLRFHLNRPKGGRFIAGIAFLTTGSFNIKLLSKTQVKC